MSSSKRKAAAAGQSATKSSKAPTEDRPTKRRKSDTGSVPSEKKVAKTSKNEDAPPTKNPTVSRLKEEEPLFPRGGGSLLTPLEHKEIQAQAKKDVLFEAGTGVGSNKADKAAKKRRKSVSKDDSHSTRLLRDEDAVRIESLNYKRLVKGSLVLGQVCGIGSLEISVALPNNLTGHLPITAISETLTERLEAEVVEEEGGESKDDDIDLDSTFSIGQYLRVYVSSTMEDVGTTSGKARRRIELSAKPEVSNSGLSAEDLVSNCTVMASIASVEDHGFVMNLGISESQIRGFLPRKEVDPSIPEGRMQPGAVLLCLVTSRKANGNIAQLSALSEKLGKTKHFPSEATTINTFLPGTVVDVLVSDISSRGISGKVLGHLDVTADVTHSGAGPNNTDLDAEYKIGSKIRARVICTFPAAQTPKLGISLLPHVLSLQPQRASIEDEEKDPLEILKVSSLLEVCTVRKVEPDIGLWTDVGVGGLSAFVHISRVKEGKVEALYEASGPYKVGTVHRGRVVGYNALDGMFFVSFEQHILDQQYLRIHDIPVGQAIDGVVERLIINEHGVAGIIVKLAEGISGLVPETHLADVQLQHPEKKFKEGMKVKARVLSTDPANNQLRLTLKKSLVNSETVPIKSFDEVFLGLQALGTIINVLTNGAVVQFYGSLRGFLPIAEMSEAYIRDPKVHFRVGQVVAVHVINVDAETNKLIVSCKDPSAFGLEKQLALKNLKLGDLVAAKVTQKSEDDVFVELVGSGLKATLPLGHLTDKSTNKNQAALKRIRVGQTLSELVVTEMNEARRALTLSQKPSLVESAQKGSLLTSLAQAKVGSLAAGFVRNVIPTAVFVQFAGGLTGLLPKRFIPSTAQAEPNFGMHNFQPLTVRVKSIENDRLILAMPSTDESTDDGRSFSKTKVPLNPLDESILSFDDIIVGKITKAKITSVKDTQLNVQLAENIHGRIDATELFDSPEEIPSLKAPLERFHEKQILRCRILGTRDAPKHNYLPITHRSSHAVIDLTAKASSLTAKDLPEPLSLSEVKVGSEWLGFVNNYGPNYLWISLSPIVRGRLNVELSQVKDLAVNFPLGSAIRVKVTGNDNGRLDLGTHSTNPTDNMTWDSIKQNMVLAGKVTKVNDRQVMVQLSSSLSGPLHLVDLSDDYDQAVTAIYSKNEIIKVSVVELDKSNKKIRLSTRASRILNSSLKAEDPEITKDTTIEAGRILRGFVKNVTDMGVFVNLGGDVTGFVRVSDLSDKFLKEWKDHFQIDQLVKGRVVSVDAAGQIRLSLKASVVDKEYVPLLTLESFKEGQEVTGKVRKVEEYGAFITIDGSANVSGLCHRSEMAAKPVKDARTLYKEGDVVKAKVLAVNLKKRQINFGLKPAYFDADSQSDMDVDDDEDAGAALGSDREEDDDVDGIMKDIGDIITISGTDNVEDDQDSDGDIEMAGSAMVGLGGLQAGGFDWSGQAMDEADDESGAELADESGTVQKPKKRRKAEIQVDRTGDLDRHGPQTSDDFERLLLGSPDDSSLWIAYMALQMQVSELAKAREIAERAIKTINMREETEKLNVWIAYINLEVAYGTDDTVDDLFKRACQYNDEQEIYERVTSIYIQSGKIKEADQTFQGLTKKFGSKSPQVWINYAHFLYQVAAQPERARALLSRAMQAVDKSAHVLLVSKFAALEFHSASGNAEQGRTLFAGLLEAWPKKFDLWNQRVDLEISLYAAEKAKGGSADAKAVREVFEQGMKVKGLKARRAKGWFQRWARWEEENGDGKAREAVSGKAREWAAEAERRKGERGGEVE